MNRHLFRVIRRLNQHTQADAARRFQVSQSAVSKWEVGTIKIGRRHLSKLRSYALSAVNVLLEPLGMNVEEP